MATYQSYVKVIDSNGKPVRNVYVELRWDWVWSSGTTDSNGVATINHTEKYFSANIYINKTVVGTMPIPGSTTVRI